MTDTEASSTTEGTHQAAPARDVEMSSVDAHAETETSDAIALIATLPAENGVHEAENSAALSPVEEKSETVEDSTMSSNDDAQPPAAADNNTVDSDMAPPVSADVTGADSSLDVNMEESVAEASPIKRKEPTAAAVEPVASTEANGDSVEEPTAKRLKVVSKPSAVVSPTADAPTATATAPPTTPPAATVAATAVSAPIMMSRDDMAKLEEDTGLVKFDVITNDGTPEHMVQLTTLKNIFARQLPKMPREYIVRLVFDRNHRSMVILKNGKTVIGGICYRPFEPNHFAEIAFCAINAADQVKGYGTRLMNHLKEFVKASGVTHFLTYADNYAIGYFKKQGFAKVVSMPRPNWFGYIKDYDGGTLMECTIHHQINYLRITSMVHEQRKKIQDKIKERSHTDIVYPGLTKFAEGRTMDLYMIPGVQEAGWTRAVIRNSRVGTRDPGSLKTQLQQLWKHVSSHRSAWPFHEPVDTTIVVDYLDYIKEPVDLTLIQKRIESGHYLSKVAFKDDLDKMCNNCMLYNTPDTNYYKAAKDLQEFIEKRVQVAK